MATNFIPLSNASAEVSPTGRVVRKGIRFNDTGKQPVINVKAAFKRSYLPQGEGAKWVNVEQYYELALWGERAVNLKNQLERYGELSELTETKEIRVKITFSMSDITVGKPWGGDNGQAPRNDLNIRTSSIELVSVNDNNFDRHSEAAPEAEVEVAPEEVKF